MAGVVEADDESLVEQRAQENGSLEESYRAKNLGFCPSLLLVLGGTSFLVLARV